MKFYEDENADEIDTPYQKVLRSKGMQFINRMHSRSFSLHALKIRDPDQGLHIMSHGNEDAMNQTHRELNRLIHNFVASSKSLIDHTRVFMADEYQDSQLHEK